MRITHTLLCGLLFCLMLLRTAVAYVEQTYTLGRVINESTSISVLRVEKVDKEKNLIIYRKVQDLKGTLAGDVVKHNIGRAGFHPREWQSIMDWAEPGHTAIFFNNGGASETCINNYWYQAYSGGEWWNMSHGEPYMLRSYAGNPEKLVSLITAMLAGQDVITPCMVDGDKNALQTRSGRIQRLKASLKIVDYNPQRDFVGWGGDDFRSVSNMPAFSQAANIARVDPEAQGVAIADADGDGKPDFCVYGLGRVALLKVDGNSLSEMSLPVTGGARSVQWADYNGDNKPDLLVATPLGLRLLTNQGGSFKDDSAGLPQEAYYNVTAASWMDFDGDKKPDILWANGFLGLRLYRNVNASPQKLFEDVSTAVRLGPDGIGSTVKGNHLAVADINSDQRPDFLYSAGNGLLAANTPQGFVVVKDSGINYQTGAGKPLLVDLDGDKQIDLFVPSSGGCKLFANRGGRFFDVSTTAGALTQNLGIATNAMAMDWNQDGRPDIFVACLKGPNRFFLNQASGKFADASAQLGIDQGIYNTRDLAAADINQDGALDLILNNEGQDSMVLMGKLKTANAADPQSLKEVAAR